MTSRRLRPRWKLKAANWPQWKNSVPPQATVPDNVEDEANNFTKVIFETAKSNFGRTKGSVKKKYSKPWWDAVCAKAVARRRRAKKQMERRPTIGNIIEFRRTSAKARSVIKSAKKHSWRKFCHSLSAETPQKIVWNMLRKLSGKGTSSDIPLKDNDLSIYDDKRKTDILAENLWNTIGKEPANISPDKEETLQEARDSLMEGEINCRFSMKELQDCLKDLPGDRAT